MLEKLTPAAERRADQAVQRQIDRLAATPTPPGVKVEPVDGGIALSGKGLRRRILDHPQLRNFAK